METGKSCRKSHIKCPISYITGYGTALCDLIDFIQNDPNQEAVAHLLSKWKEMKNEYDTRNTTE